MQIFTWDLIGLKKTISDWENSLKYYENNPEKFPKISGSKKNIFINNKKDLSYF